MIKQELLKNIPSRADIIGVPISAVNMDSCVKFLFNNWEAAHGNYICVSNVHTTVMAHDDKKYYKTQADSLLSVPDGKPLSVVGRKKYPEMDRVTGPDLMRRIFQEAKSREMKHFFYGSTQENIDALVESVGKEYPWVQIVGSEPSVFRDMTDGEEQQLADSGISLAALKVDGGASANDFLMQTQADIIDAPVNRPQCVETTAMGAAYLAGLAVGYWANKEDVIKNWAIDKTFKPSITEEDRMARIKGWNKAVKYAYGWAKED